MNTQNCLPRFNSRSKAKTSFAIRTMICGIMVAGFSTAHATTMASADIQAQLTVSPLGTIQYIPGFNTSFPNFTSTGNASATAVAPAPTNLGNGIFLTAQVTANAAPTTGAALGEAPVFGNFELMNRTVNDIDVTLTLMYSWNISGSINNPSLEQARAAIALDLSVDFVSLTTIVEGNTAPPDFRMGSGSSMDMFNVTIPALESTFVELSAGAESAAIATTVPEPSTLLLFGSGIAGLLLYQRKQRK